MENDAPSIPFIPPWCAEFVIPGTAALDVGANLGEFIPELSRGVGPTGHVYAIEPGPLLREVRLRPIVKEHENVTLYPYAIGEDRRERRVFHYRDWTLLPVDPKDERYMVRDYHPGQQNEFKEEFTIEYLPLDAFICLHVHPDLPVSFVKIDVDGDEYRVLKGAGWMLDVQRPVLYMEIGTPTTERLGHTSQNIVDLVTERGYRIIANDLGNPLPTSGEGFIRYIHSLHGEAVADALCLPQEHTACNQFFTEFTKWK